MTKTDSTQTEKHPVRKTMKALGIIILFGLFIMMIASVMYIYRESCMTMFGTAIGLTVLLLAAFTSFILIKKMMHANEARYYFISTRFIMDRSRASSRLSSFISPAFQSGRTVSGAVSSHF